MDYLPAVVLYNIRQFLGVRDILACSAVNKHWRDCLNQNHVWRPYCDMALVIHLKVTECRVEPRFVSPEQKDSTLSPICEWRLSYMREMHLWNNWKNNRFIKEPFGRTVSALTFVKFLNDSFVLIKSPFQENVMLWNISGTPLYLCNPITLEHASEVNFCVVMNDKILLIQRKIVQIYLIDTTTTQPWQRLGVYNLSSVTYLPNYILISGYVLVAGSGRAFELFDLERKETMNVSVVPGNFTIRVKNFFGDKECKHIAVLVTCTKAMVWGYMLYVYSMEQMSFLTFEAYIPGIRDSHCVICSFHNEFVVLVVNEVARVYNYLTSEVVFGTTDLCISRLDIRYEVRMSLLNLDEDWPFCNTGASLEKEEKPLVLMDESSFESSPFASQCSRYKLYDAASLIAEGKRKFTFFLGVSNDNHVSPKTAVFNKLHAIVMHGKCGNITLCTFW